MRKAEANLQRAAKVVALAIIKDTRKPDSYCQPWGKYLVDNKGPLEAAGLENSNVPALNLAYNPHDRFVTVNTFDSGTGKGVTLKFLVGSQRNVLDDRLHHAAQLTSADFEDLFSSGKDMLTLQHARVSTSNRIGYELAISPNQILYSSPFSHYGNQHPLNNSNHIVVDRFAIHMEHAQAVADRALAG